MANPAFDNIKEMKQLMQDFQEKRVQVFIKHNTSQDLSETLEAIKKQLIDRFEEQKIQSKMEIKKAEVKKTNLIRRLVLMEKVKDIHAQDQIIQELEEYSRIRRYREAQLARINKEIQDLNLSQTQFQEKVKKGEGQPSSPQDVVIENI